MRVRMGALVILVLVVVAIGGGYRLVTGTLAEHGTGVCVGAVQPIDPTDCAPYARDPNVDGPTIDGVDPPPFSPCGDPRLTDPAYGPPVPEASLTCR